MLRTASGLISAANGLAQPATRAAFDLARATNSAGFGA
jgi:hypothetical protein